MCQKCAFIVSIVTRQIKFSHRDKVCIIYVIFLHQGMLSVFKYSMLHSTAFWFGPAKILLPKSCL